MALRHDARENSALETPPPPGERGSGGNVRWTICALLFFCTAINYIDRQVIGILKPQLARDLRWSEQDYANIVTAFQFTYACGYLFGGRLMDRFGARRGLPVAALLWSIAAGAHGFVRTARAFCYARFGLGLAEGGNFPASIRIVSEWFPVKERALATGIFNSASNVGAIVCPLTIPWLALRFGWQSAFFVTGALGLIWIAAWKLVYRDIKGHPKLSASEKAYIEEGKSEAVEPVEAPAISWVSLLGLKATWAYILGTVLTSPVWWFYLFWIPDFLHKRFHLSLERTGFLTSLVYAISVVGSIGGGWFAERLIARGWTLNAARKAALLLPACCVVPVFAAVALPGVWPVVLLVGIATASHQAWSANLYTFASDTMPKSSVSSVVGLGGFAGGIASMFVAQAVGWVLTATGSYVPLFGAASLMYVIAFALMHVFVPRIRPAAAGAPS